MNDQWSIKTKKGEFFKDRISKILIHNNYFQKLNAEKEVTDSTSLNSKQVNKMIRWKNLPGLKHNIMRSNETIYYI